MKNVLKKIYCVLMSITMILGIVGTISYAATAKATDPINTTNNNSLTIGVGKSEIDIPDSYFPQDGLTGVHDKLYTKTLLLDNGTTKIALVDIDLTSFGSDQLDDKKAIISSATGVDPANIIICCSHTFSAPHALPDARLNNADDKKKNNLIIKAISDSFLNSATAAKKNMQPAKIGYGTGSCDVNVNRDVLTNQGWWLGSNPQGASDKDVDVIKFEDQRGNPLAVLMNYAVQSSVMSGSVMNNGGKLVTADLAGAAANYIEKQYNGAVAMFTTGAAGDQAPLFTANRTTVDINGQSSSTDIHDAGFDVLNLLGERLGSETVRVSENINSSQTQIPLRIIRDTIKCNGQRMPGPDLKATKNYSYQSDNEVNVPIEIIQIGDIAIVGVAQEMACQLGMDIKKASPFKNTIVMTMCDGAEKYMADAKSYDNNTYEAMNSKIAKGSGELVEGKIISMLNQVKYNSNDQHIKSITAITEVFGDGQKITAAALEYDKAIDNSKLDKSAFTVDGRTITNVYANTTATKAVHGSNGNYVIIELSPDDNNASILVRNGGKATKADAKVSVTQVGNIVTTDGKTYNPSFDTKANDKVSNLIVDDFKQLDYKDAKYGKTLMYNLYVPKNYDKSKSYPMVLFMPDASATSTDHDRTLIQGNGGVIWASDAEQAKHECFVLCPQYSTQNISDTETTDYLDITVDLVKSIQSQYSIDKNRLYTTGQSGGCMMSITMDIKYPDLFAASFLVAGQWDATKVAPMAKQKLWIIVSEGDTKAFPGMNDITAALEKEGAKVSRAKLNGKSSKEEFAADVSKVIAEGNSIIYTPLKKGTVVPAGSPDDSISNHMGTWKITYNIEGVRDWLFAQKK